jgi:hypothetical protein
MRTVIVSLRRRASTASWEVIPATNIGGEKPMKAQEFREKLEAELDGVLDQDEEIIDAAKNAGLPLDELRNQVIGKKEDVRSSVVPEFNRLEAVESQRFAITKAASSRRWTPPRSVTVPRNTLLATAVLIALVYLLAWISSLFGGELPWGLSPLRQGPRTNILLAGTAVACAILAGCMHSANRVVANRIENSPRTKLLDQQIKAEEELCTQALREKGVKALLRELINAEKPSFSNVFGQHEAVGLAELRDPLFEIRTQSRADMEKLLASMPGGSIGVSGVRGVGKTTLLRRFCSPDYRTDSTESEKSAVRILLSVPVRYDPRDFILHLFSTVCTVLANPNRRPQTWGSATDRVPDFFRVVLARILRVIPLFLVAWGFVLIASVLWHWKLVPSLQPGVIAVVVGVSTAYAVSAGRNAERRHWESTAYWRPWRGEDYKLAESAEELLRGLAYQQSFASGWSAGVNLPVGSQVGVTQNTTMTEKPMTFPELVDRLNSFLRLVSREREVFIGIDELDKIESSEAACQFLNDIKGIFGHDDCYYLVSISQNAMSSFERRGLPVRDAFDSAFDAIVEVEYLDLTEAERLLRRRVIGMPVAFLCLCYVFSGGLPRDLIRVARDVVGLAHAPSATGELGELASALVRRDVLRKVQAIRVAVQAVAYEPQAGMLVEMLDAASEDLLQASAGDDSQIELILQKILEPNALYVRVEEGDGAVLEKLDELRRLRIELAAYLYFCISVLSFFGVELASDDLAKAEESNGPDGVRRLAKARQAFSGSPRRAWIDVSAFRAAWGLEESLFPDWLFEVGEPAQSAATEPPVGVTAQGQH